MADMVVAQCEYEFVDIDQLSKDLSYILVDKAKTGSSIFHRIQNLQAQGGIRMYAEVYKWFTETSGLGLMEQAAKAMSPNQAAKEENISEAIELWEEKMNRLARYGEEYQLSEAFKKVALKKILVGKLRDNFELWQADKLPFEELLKKVKEQSRAKKLDTDANQGKAVVAVRA